MWAAAEGHTAVVKRLIEAGADPRIRSEAGFSALMFAVREGRLQVVNALLKSGSDPNETLPPRKRRRTGATEFGPPEGGASALDVAVANAHFRGTRGCSIRGRPKRFGSRLGSIAYDHLRSQARHGKQQPCSGGIGKHGQPGAW